MSGPLHAAGAREGGWSDRAHRSPHSATQAPGREALRRLSTLFAEASEILGDLAETGDIQLAAGAGASLMEPVTPVPDQPSPGTDLLSVDDRAETLQVSPRTIRRWRSEGKLPPALEFSGVLRWRREAVERWIAEREAGRDGQEASS